MVRIAILVLAAAGLTAPAAASVNMARIFEGEFFASRGACESALSHERNGRRRDGDTGPFTTEDTYNAYLRYHFDCVEVDRGVWMVARVR